MTFEHCTNYRGASCLVATMDDNGSDLAPDTVGAHEFYAYPRDMTHNNPMQPDLASPAYAYRWECSYRYGTDTADLLADGYADSLEACKRDFLQLWPTLATCHSVYDPRIEGMQNYGTPYQF